MLDAGQTWLNRQSSFIKNNNNNTKTAVDSFCVGACILYGYLIRVKPWFLLQRYRQRNGRMVTYLYCVHVAQSQNSDAN